MDSLISAAGIAVDEDILAGVDAEVQRQTQRCMQSLGFEYVPYEVGAPPDFIDLEFDSSVALDRDETEFIDIVVTTLESNWESWENDAHLSTLSPLQRAEWEAALYGELSVTASDVPQGCYAQALSEVDLLGSNADAFETISAAIDDRLFADPAWIALEEEWFGCVREAGYDAASAANDVYSSGMLVLMNRLAVLVTNGPEQGRQTVTLGEADSRQVLDSAREVGLRRRVEDACTTAQQERRAAIIADVQQKVFLDDSVSELVNVIVSG